MVWQNGHDVGAAVAERYGKSGSEGGARQDAIRHSTWNAVCAQIIGQGDTFAATKANEHFGKHQKKAFSSNATMDLQNNWTGAATYVGTDRDLQGWITELEAVYDLGFLFRWEPPEKNVSSHDHMMRKSTGAKIFPN